MAAPARLCRLVSLLLIFLLFIATPTFSSEISDTSVDLDDDPSEAEALENEEESLNTPSSDDFNIDEIDGDMFGDDDSSFDIAIDDYDVVVLSSQNFSDFTINNHYVMVEFYAPWCGHCQALAPEYAAAATELKKHQVTLAKVDATIEFDLAKNYEVQGYPTLLFFIDGVQKPYSSHRTKDGIISWVKKKIGPSVSDITATIDAQKLLESGNTIVVAFFERLEGPEVEEFAAAARQEDDILFHQTTNEDVGYLFNIKKGTKSPSLVLLKNSTEKISHYDGKFERDSISDFILANKLPLVTTFSKEVSRLIFESPIKKQLVLFVTPEDHTKVFPVFEAAAKSFKGKILFVHVDSSDKEVGKPIMEFFGVKGKKPEIVGYIASTEQPKKFLFEDEITLANLKAFGADFLAGMLKQFYKSEPIPDKNDGDVKIVVSKNFDEIVLDESKDVLLEIYDPGCGYCQALEPTYNKLAKVLRSVDSLVISKMDGTANEHPRAKPDGFPTLLFFPAGSKSFEPITVETDRTVKAMYQFLKKNAAIPFAVPKKRTQEDTSTSSTVTQVTEPKDEL